MNSKKRILSILLALVMVFGSFPSVFAEGISDQTAQREKTVEIEGKNDGRKLVFNLQEKTNSLRKASTFANGPRKAPANDPGHGENDVKVKINLSGVNGKEFPFATIFPNGAKVKLELLDMDTFETTTVEKDFTADGQEIGFGIYKEEQIQNITIELADNVNIAGKIIQNTTSGTGGHLGTTVFNLYLYQYVNTDVKVTTVDESGNKATNPTTTATKGTIKVTAGQEEKEIDIPAETNDTETFKDRDVNVKNVSNFQSSPTVEVTGLNDKGVLVDKAANKVYKPEVKVYPDGLKATEIKFTEKPIWSEDNKYATDPEYVAVTFDKGDHGTIATNKTYYVFKGVDMGKTLSAPNVTADTNYEFNGWDPTLATKYENATEHVAQYTKGLPTVTTTEPSADNLDKYATITFVPKTKTVNREQQYGTIKTTDDKVVTPNAENNSLRYWVLKTATWQDVRDFEDNGHKVFVEIIADNGADSTNHPFIGWKKHTDIVNPFDNNFFGGKDAATTFETLGNYTFESKFKANDYIVDKSINTKRMPSNDSDGYEIKSNDYTRIMFTIEKNNRDKAKLETAKNFDKYKTYTDDTTTMSVWIANDLLKDTNPDKPTFGTIKPTVTINNQEYKFWYWDQTTAQKVAVQDNATLADKQLYTAHLIKNGQEIVNDDPELPKDEAFKVTLNRDAETVNDATGTDGKSVYGRTYAIFKDSNLKEAGVIVPTPEATQQGQTASWYEEVDGKDTVVNNPETETITKDRTFTAKGINDIVPQKPGEEKPDVPADFVLVEFKQGDHGTIAETETTKYWVNPTAKKTLAEVTKPAVTANEGFKHTGWDTADTEEIKANLTVTAQYKEKVVTTDPQDTDYVKVNFVTSKGSLDGTSEYWVLKDTEVTVSAPTVTGLTNYEFKAWDPEVKTTYKENTTHNATFNYAGDDIVPQKPGEEKPDVPADFVLVEFKAGANGTIAETETTKYWVNPDANKTLADVKKPSVTANEGWEHTGWDKTDDTAITKALEVTAEYTQNQSIVANPVQKYHEPTVDEPTDDQYIEGILPEGKTLPKDATVELVVKNGDNYEKVDVPVTTDGGVIKVDVKKDNIKHGETYYFAIKEKGKTTSYSDTPVTIDKQGPNMGTAGEEITLVQDAYGYQVKVSAKANDDAGILRVYAEEDKDNGYYDENAENKEANLAESIQNQLGVEKVFKVTAVDKFGNKTEKTKTAEATGSPIMVKAERPLDGDDFIYVTTDVGASLVITVINKDKTEAFTMTYEQTAESEEIKLVGTDGTPFKLSKGQKVKVKASIKGKEDNTLTIRVR